MITNFFKRKFDSATVAPESGSQSKKKINKNVDCQLKTVKKWMTEMNVDLGYVVRDDSDVVREVWCVACRQFSKDTSSSMVVGSTRVKKEAVQQHTKSVSHQRAVGAMLAAQQEEKNELSPLEKGFRIQDEDDLVKMDKLFRTAMYLVKREKPFSDFCDLIELQNLNDARVGATYGNDKAAKDFVSSIADYYVQDLSKSLKSADYFSVFCDGSTDNSEVEKELIMVKVMINFYPEIKFLKLEEPPNTKAAGILEAIDNAFTRIGLPDYKQKLVGFCSDGASVMMGERRGVIKLLKDAGDANWILSVWCLAHRLELAVKDAFRATYMDTVIEVLQSIYYFYKGSAKRTREANDIADIMDEHFRKPAKANGTRWVEHKLLAVTKLIINWKVIVMHMNNYAEDVTNRPEDRAKAKGYISKLTQYKLVWYMYFVKDVLSEVTKVSLTFQREDINVSSAVTKIKSAQIALRNMMYQPGPQLQEFQRDVVGNQFRDHNLHNVVDQEVLIQQKREILQDIIDCIDRRFENIFSGDQVYVACHVFDHKNWPDSNDGNALYQYGVEDLRLIIDHFRPLLNTIQCDTVAAQVEWSDLKIHVGQNVHFRGVHPLAVWQRVSQEDANRQDYSNIMKVVHLTSIYPLSNASCERAFSTMKRIKTDWRCSLSNDTMDMLMRVDIEGPQLRDFIPRPFVNRWWINGSRAKRPTTLPYGPRLLTN